MSYFFFLCLVFFLSWHSFLIMQNTANVQKDPLDPDKALYAQTHKIIKEIFDKHSLEGVDTFNFPCICKGNQAVINCYEIAKQLGKTNRALKREIKSIIHDSNFTIDRNSSLMLQMAQDPQFKASHWISITLNKVSKDTQNIKLMLESTMELWNNYYHNQEATPIELVALLIKFKGTNKEDRNSFFNGIFDVIGQKLGSERKFSKRTFDRSSDECQNQVMSIFLSLYGNRITKEKIEEIVKSAVFKCNDFQREMQSNLHTFSQEFIDLIPTRYCVDNQIPIVELETTETIFYPFFDLDNHNCDDDHNDDDFFAIY